MPAPDSDERDRLSPATVHHLQVLLSNLRMQEQMVQRWLRRQGASGDIEVMRERLETVDATVVQLADELNTREAKDAPPERQNQSTPAR